MCEFFLVGWLVGACGVIKEIKEWEGTESATLNFTGAEHRDYVPLQSG